MRAAHTHLLELLRESLVLLSQLSQHGSARLLVLRARAPLSAQLPAQRRDVIAQRLHRDVILGLERLGTHAQLMVLLLQLLQRDPSVLSQWISVSAVTEHESSAESF